MSEQDKCYWEECGVDRIFNTLYKTCEGNKREKLGPFCCDCGRRISTDKPEEWRYVMVNSKRPVHTVAADKKNATHRYLPHSTNDDLVTRESVHEALADTSLPVAEINRLMDAIHPPEPGTIILHPVSNDD